MRYMISASTDIGISKKTNQDSLAVRLYDSSYGEICFAVLCDGMGGLSKGELASAEVVKAFCNWSMQSLPAFCANGLSEDLIRQEWTRLAVEQNVRISNYSKAAVGSSVGTTIAVALFVGNRYYMMNVGDSRVYQITSELVQLTNDHSVVAEKIRQGVYTKTQALNDPMRSVLTQCIGASPKVTPEYYFGTVAPNAVYMLCSDGFIHYITDEELLLYMAPSKMADSTQMKQVTDYLINENKSRRERDNISVITVRTF